MKERRSAPRYTCQTAINVHSTDNHTHSAQACNISEIGISFYLDDKEILNLYNEGVILNIGDAFNLTFKSNHNNSNSAIHCLVKQVRRLSQNMYLVGAWFNHLKAEEQLIINNLLKEARTAENTKLASE